MRAHLATRKLIAATQTHFIRGPGGRPRLTFELLPWNPAGYFAHLVKCARIKLAVSCSPQPQPHFIRGPRGKPPMECRPVFSEQ